MKRAIREHWRDFAAIVGLLLISAGVSAYILTEQRFRFPVITEKPLRFYAELTDGRIVRLGSATIIGNTTVEQKVPLGQVPVKRALMNHNYDVLALEQK